MKDLMHRQQMIRSRRETPVDAPERRRLPQLLRRAWFNLNQAFRRRSLTAGITPDQFTVLRTLREQRRRGLSQRELAQKMTSDPNTIASLLRRMERSGLVARRPDPADRRAYRVVLTGLGRTRFARVRPLAAHLQSQVLAALTEERRERFLEDLERVAAACQQATRDGP
ncbi:MAG: MarR family transcriptional regulator [Verrucomicrobia bacterium]|nr:MarR family transcriptional regulator [Verrucomicrobiota bacterium]